MTLVRNRVRPMIYALAIAGLSFMGLIAACQSKQEKVESAREELQDQKEDVAEERHDVAEEQRDVQEAQVELNEAQRQARVEWQQDYLSFKRDMITEIADNEKLILEKREQLAALDAQRQGNYTTAISDAEHRNNELRDQLNNASDQGDEAWTKFKEDFKSSINQVEESIKNIDVK